MDFNELGRQNDIKKLRRSAEDLKLFTDFFELKLSGMLNAVKWLYEINSEISDENKKLYEECVLPEFDEIERMRKEYDARLGRIRND